jgi:hypothetical protein
LTATLPQRILRAVEDRQAQAPNAACPWTCMAVAGIAVSRALSRLLLVRRFRRQLAQL